MRTLAAAALLVLLAGCAESTPPSPTGVTWPAWEPARDQPAEVVWEEGRQGPNGLTILHPASAPLATGVPYRYTLGHCGLLSPVDVDRSFWVAIDGVDASGEPLDLDSDVDMINATSGIIVVIDQEARFRSDAGAIVRFQRHEGERGYPGCD